MSSKAVRDAIEAAVMAAAAPLPVYDLSDYQSLSDVLPTADTTAVLLQFVVADEEMRTIGNEGNQGWEETGTAVIHIMVPQGDDSGDTVTLCDSIRTALRGRRVAPSITIETCEPFTDFGGSAVNNDPALWKGWASNLFYRRKDCG